MAEDLLNENALLKEQIEIMEEAGVCESVQTDIKLVLVKETVLRMIYRVFMNTARRLLEACFIIVKKEGKNAKSAKKERNMN